MWLLLLFSDFMSRPIRKYDILKVEHELPFYLESLGSYSTWCCSRAGNTQGPVRDVGRDPALGHVNSLGVRQAVYGAHSPD